MRRKTPLARSGRVRPVNRKRRDERHARNFGEEAERVRNAVCLVARASNKWAAARCSPFGARACHVTARGMGGAKGGRFDLVPLCDAHHREAGEAETSQRAAFEQRYGLDLRAQADRIALEHPRPLGIRGLADRWPPADRQCGECSAPAVYRDEYGEQFCADHGSPLDSYESDALLGWVRRRMARDGQALETIDFIRMSQDIASALGFLDEDGDIDTELADALCKAAGWPS